MKYLLLVVILVFIYIVYIKIFNKKDTKKIETKIERKTEAKIDNDKKNLINFKIEQIRIFNYNKDEARLKYELSSASGNIEKMNIWQNSYNDFEYKVNEANKELIKLLLN